MINKYNNKSLTEHKTPLPPTTTHVSEFLNQASPVKKKRSFLNLVDKDNEVVAFDINDEKNFDDDNVGLVDNVKKTTKGNKGGKSNSKGNNDDKGYKVKKEKVAKATKSQSTTRVSTRRKKNYLVF